MEGPTGLWEIDFQLVTVAASSNISEVMYDKARATVRVTFKSGSRYDYYGVSQLIIDEWQKAESSGKFFHKHLRDDAFPCRIIGA